MYRRDHLHSKAIKYSAQSLWDEYRKLRNYITYLINKSKRVFFTTRIQQSKGNLGQMWHTLNEALNKPSISNSSINLSPDNVNDYFSSVGNKVSELFSGNEHTITCSNSTIRNQLFTFSPISEQTLPFSLISPAHKMRSLVTGNWPGFLLFSKTKETVMMSPTIDQFLYLLMLPNFLKLV